MSRVHPSRAGAGRPRPGHLRSGRARSDHARPSRLWRWTKRGLIAIGVLLILALLPVVWVETSCYSKETVPNSFQSRLPKQFQREEVNSYLTYPEWSIVHAYQDLVAVAYRSSESDFDYASYTAGYWQSLCHIVGYASARGPVSGEYRSMLHIIGVSFSAEMAVKGLWETTVGRLTAWLRGGEKTPEDLFALKVANEYAAFLYQTPWYEFPFAAKLSEFWSTTPFGSRSWPRAIERRIALTLEYGGKSIYAQAIGALAAASPAELRIRSVVEGGDPAGIEGVQVIGRLDGGKATVIETPRYAAFDKIIRAFAAAGISFSEIAGNDDIMVAVLVPKISKFPFEGATELLSAPAEFRPPYRRVMVSVPVKSLTAMIRAVDAGGAEIEHVYDY
jgi:hypothetical protein